MAAARGEGGLLRRYRSFGNDERRSTMHHITLDGETDFGGWR